jgi:hypothetical protein
MTSVAFELDRFVAEDERLEVIGRWVGVRGRRFVRPSLSAVVDGHSKRALAELEHKPWAAEDGDWMAAFRWSGPVDGIDDFELAVAPDLAVRLPPPSDDGRSGPELTLPAVESGDDADSGRGGAAERDSTPAGHQEALAELDEALAARAQALAERDEALAAGAQALAELDEALAARAQALAERDEALAAGAQALAERDEALAARAQALAERNEALAARDDAIAARGVTSVQLERALAELTHAQHNLALWQRATVRLRNEPQPTDEPNAPATRRITRSRALSSDGKSALNRRVLTVLAIAGAILLLVIVLVTSGGVVPVAGH